MTIAMSHADNAARAKMLAELAGAECLPQARDAYEFLFVKDWNDTAEAYRPMRVGSEPALPPDGAGPENPAYQAWHHWRAATWMARRENAVRLATCVWALNVVRRLAEREGAEGPLVTMRGRIGRFLRDEWRVNEDPPREPHAAIETWAEAHLRRCARVAEIEQEAQR